MPTFYLPLSGSVQQDINPWSWATRIANGQVGLININLGKSSEPELERHILDDVGSYGRQIGQLGDALEAVLDHLPTETWDAKAREAVQDLRDQLRQVRRLKKKYGR